MWVYEKKLQYPINIKQTNPALAKIIISQYGGPDGELGASLRYLSQRYSVPYPEIKAILTDIGTEEYVPISYQLSLRKKYPTAKHLICSLSGIPLSQHLIHFFLYRIVVIPCRRQLLFTLRTVPPLAHNDFFGKLFNGLAVQIFNITRCNLFGIVQRYPTGHTIIGN